MADVPGNQAATVGVVHAMKPKWEGGIERALTDAGATGDKIKAEDPAVAPLHTDAEAAGVATTRGAVMMSIGRRVHLALRTPAPDTFGAWTQPRDKNQRRLARVGLAWTAVTCLLGIALGVIGLLG